MIPQEIYDSGERIDPMNIRVVTIDSQGIARDVKFHLTSHVDASGETPCIVVDEVQELKAEVDRLDRLYSQTILNLNALTAERDRLRMAIEEMRSKCKHIVLNMTGIPVGARNPTRDWQVIHGERIAEQIDKIVLTCQPKEGEGK